MSDGAQDVVDELPSIENDDVITVSDLMGLFKNLDKNMWVCATIEGHAYPLTICNAGILESGSIKNRFGMPQDRKMVFLDINKNCFMDFLDKEILSPMRKTTLQ